MELVINIKRSQATLFFYYFNFCSTYIFFTKEITENLMKVEKNREHSQTLQFGLLPGYLNIFKAMILYNLSFSCGNIPSYCQF